MRPLHALLLVAALAAALLAALFLVGTDEHTTGDVAPPAADAPSRSTKPADAPLHAPDGADPTPGGTRTAKSVEPAVKPPEPPAKWSTSTLPGFTLRGRVVTPNGQPIANAKIYAAPAQGLPEIALDEMDAREMPWLKRIDTQSDDDGRFALQPQAQGSLRLAVRASGYAPHDADVPIAGTEKDIGEVKLEPGVVLTGRVVDTAGRPVVGAELRHRRESGGLMILGGPRGALLAKSDENGRFKVDQLASGAWKIAVTSEDHPDKIESGETDRAGATVSNLEFVLEDGAEIQGRVVDAPANSLSNVWVRAAPRPSGPGEEGGGGPNFASELSTSPFGYARRAKCTSDGNFTLRGLKKGQSYRLVGREGEGDFGGRTRTQALQVKAGDRGIQLHWKPETALVFQVVDSSTGAPLTDFVVEAGYGWSLPLQGEDGRPVKHFKDGRVRFANLPQKPEGQTAQLSIEAVGYKRYERKSLEPIEGQDLELGVIRLERAPLVRVLVLDDASGAPIANASVRLEADDPQDANRRMFLSLGDADGEDFGGPGRAQRAKTDAEGRASVTSLPGSQAILRVRHNGHATYASAPLALPLVGDVEETVRLKVGGTVVVEVVDAKGVPVPGQAIQHVGPDGKEPPLMIGGDASDQTDAHGKVVFEHLEAGRHRFRLRERTDDMMAVGGGTFVRAVRKGDEKPSGPEWSDVEVGERTQSELRLAAPARSNLTGRVSEGGKALTGATVRLVEPTKGDAPEMPFFGDGKEARTNGKGEYSLDNVKEGEYRVLVSHASRAMSFETSVKLREGDNELNVEMPVCTIEGRVANAEGKPLAGVRVRAERAQPEDGKHKVPSRVMMFATADGEDSNFSFTTGTGGAEPALTDAEGKYRLRGVLPDVDLVVKATGKDVQPGQSAAVRLVPDQTKSGVDLTLQQGGSIEVTIVHADGRPGSSCLVRGKIDGDSVDPKTEFSGASGVVKLTGLKPGKWHLNVSPIGPGSVAGPDKSNVPEQVVEVKAGEAAKARFEIP